MIIYLTVCLVDDKSQFDSLISAALVIQIYSA